MDSDHHIDEQEFRRFVVRCCMQLTEDTALQVEAKERELLELFASGQLSIEQVLSLLEDGD